MKQIVLDTETTGLDAQNGHRIIEIGCVEMINRRLTGNHFHYYLNPDRDIDEAAEEVHGINRAFLEDKPRFPDVVDEFLAYISDAELVIHNASFDVGFINAELKRMKAPVTDISRICKITDSLLVAREKHPGQRNSLDALCKRYEVENFDRALHGALLDSEILAEVYLRMTGGQTSLGLMNDSAGKISAQQQNQSNADFSKRSLRIVSASEAEQQAHNELLALIDKKSDGQCAWLQDAKAKGEF